MTTPPTATSVPSTSAMPFGMPSIDVQLGDVRQARRPRVPGRRRGPTTASTGKSPMRASGPRGRGRDSRGHVAEREPPRAERLGPRFDEELPGRPADGGDLGDARNGRQPRADDVVLQAPQRPFRQPVPGVDDRVLKHPTGAGGVRSHHHARGERQPAAQRRPGDRGSPAALPRFAPRCRRRPPGTPCRSSSSRGPRGRLEPPSSARVRTCVTARSTSTAGCPIQSTRTTTCGSDRSGITSRESRCRASRPAAATSRLPRTTSREFRALQPTRRAITGAGSRPRRPHGRAIRVQEEGAATDHAVALGQAGDHHRAAVDHPADLHRAALECAAVAPGTSTYRASPAVKTTFSSTVRTGFGGTSTATHPICVPPARQPCARNLISSISPSQTRGGPSASVTGTAADSGGAAVKTAACARRQARGLVPVEQRRDGAVRRNPGRRPDRHREHMGAHSDEIGRRPAPGCLRRCPRRGPRRRPAPSRRWDTRPAQARGRRGAWGRNRPRRPGPASPRPNSATASAPPAPASNKRRRAQAKTTAPNQK